MNEAPAVGMAPLDAAEKARRVKEFRWFHTMDLGDGVTTPGQKPAKRLKFQASRVFRMPIAGQSVLDVGCWDGFFSFEARRRGATRVVGADHHVWNHGWGKKGAFELARACLDPSVEVREVPIGEMTPESVGRFDVTLFLGAFHHMRDPLGTLTRLAAMTTRMLVVETHVDARLAAEPPAMVFYPFKELNNDPGSWWGPNPACVVAMLKSCGFGKVEVDATYAEAGASHALIHAIR